MVLPEVGMK
ncbi:unnamed protein product [Cuscuta europaea]|uniref:Uncharacterized protein n=1 Tax=Cuscuta europaea TaxID=41803 RepID=A0A9P0ZMS6_CUSEU|nr:unnamed protein product [Cuscuta europaea]